MSKTIMSKKNKVKLYVTNCFPTLSPFIFLILLIACLCSIVLLYRDVKRLEELVYDTRRTNESPTDQDIKPRARRYQSDQGQRDPIQNDQGQEYRTNERDDADSDGDLKRPQKMNVGDSKLTIVTKDDERLLLQTADGSPWVLVPSMTRISLSTLEDFCLTTQNYCANKNSLNRLNNDRDTNQGDQDTQRAISTDSNTFSIHQSTSEQAIDEDTRTTDQSTNELNHGYANSDSTYGYMTTIMERPATSKRRKGLGRKKRKRERCFIENISKPTLIGQRSTFFGSWMQDVAPRDFDAEKRWVTEHVSGQFLLEYASVHDLKYSGSHGDASVTPHQLPYMYDGTNHLMYNGSFLYQRAGSPIIIRYHIRSGNWTETRIDGAAFNGGDFLYNPSQSHNYFDLAADENGIWVFFHYEKSNILSVARLHPKTMRLMRVWNLTRFDHTQIGDTWVTCGVMYVLDSSTNWKTRISTAYDLFRHRSALVNLPWRNTYNKTSMLSYNPILKKLHIFDNGYLLERNLIMAYPG